MPERTWKELMAMVDASLAEAKAGARLMPKIERPSFVCYRNEQVGCMIYGRLLSWNGVVDLERLSGATQEEAIETADTMERSAENGMPFGQWFSEIEPEGEFGSTPAMYLTQITEAEFEQARRDGWSSW